MDSCSWLYTTAGGESWESLKDVVSTLGSVARLGGKELPVPSPPASCRPRPPVATPFISEESSSSEGERRRRELTASERDASIQRQLRRVCGSGYSNELIEHFWHRPSSNSGISEGREVDSPWSAGSSSDSLFGCGEDVGGIGFRSARKKGGKKGFGSGEVGSREVGSREVGSGEVGSGEVGSGERRGSKLRRCRNACVLGLLKGLPIPSPPPSPPRPTLRYEVSTTDLNPDSAPFFPSYQEDREVRAYVPSYMSAPIFTQNEEGFRLDLDSFPPLS